MACIVGHHAGNRLYPANIFLECTEQKPVSPGTASGMPGHYINSLVYMGKGTTNSRNVQEQDGFFRKIPHVFPDPYRQKCIPDRKIAHRMPFRTCPRCRRQCKQRKRHCSTFSLAIYQLHPLVTGRMCQNPTQENCLVGWQKHRTSLGKSTEV